MSESINRVVISGHILRNPEHRSIGENSICKFQIASERPFINKKTGFATKEICFVDVETWGPTAASASKNIVKGDHVLVEGRLKLNSWEEAPGKKRYKHLIVGERILNIENPKGSDTTIEMATAPRGSNKAISENPTEEATTATDAAIIERIASELPF